MYHTTKRKLIKEVCSTTHVMRWKGLYLLGIIVGVWWISSLLFRIIDGSNSATITDCYIEFRCFFP